MSVAVDVQIASAVASVPDESAIAAWLELLIANTRQCSRAASFEVSVRIVDEDEGRELNRRFRQHDSATNVLSFPADCTGLPQEVPRMLGDIVISGPAVEREALEQGKNVGDHWAHLIVHGALHLLGYDHETDDEAEAMEAIEREILALRGVADPYASSH
jgi:probable rRNA maturation factor